MPLAVLRHHCLQHEVPHQEDWFIPKAIFLDHWNFEKSMEDLCLEKIHWIDVGWVSRSFIGCNEVSILCPEQFKCLACKRMMKSIAEMHYFVQKKMFLSKRLFSEKCHPDSIVDWLLQQISQKPREFSHLWWSLPIPMNFKKKEFCDKI